MKPIEFVQKLAAIAAAARHHPEPAIAVEQLAQLLLDLTNELVPIAQKYGTILQMSGFLDELENAANQAEAALAAGTENPAAAANPEPILPAGTVADLAALVDPALAGAPEFAAETPTTTTTDAAAATDAGAV